jgi:hypothetical protein
MNTIFQKTTNCRSYKNITYGVVPMSSTHGVVEWLNDMEPLKTAYIKQISEYQQEESNYNNGRRGSDKKKLPKVSLSSAYANFMKKNVSSGDYCNPKSYHELYNKSSKDFTKDFKNIELETSKGIILFIFYFHFPFFLKKIMSLSILILLNITLTHRY